MTRFPTSHAKDVYTQRTGQRETVTSCFCHIFCALTLRAAMWLSKSVSHHLGFFHVLFQPHVRRRLKPAVST